jgi:dTDP-4-amino-4,6-dideoxygalactose transaminase
LVDLLMVAATQVLLYPWLYWFPAGLPFLKLGETVYDEKFPVCRMPAFQMGLLVSWRTRLEQASQVRMRNSRMLQEQLPPPVRNCILSKNNESPALRLPVLMPTMQAKVAMCRRAREQGLGVSGLYPATIANVPELRADIQSKEFPGAETIVSRLVTLPVHRYVNEQDMDRIVKAMEQAWGEDQQSQPTAS